MQFTALNRSFAISLVEVLLELKVFVRVGVSTSWIAAKAESEGIQDIIKASTNMIAADDILFRFKFISIPFLKKIHSLVL